MREEQGALVHLRNFVRMRQNQVFDLRTVSSLATAMHKGSLEDLAGIQDPVGIHRALERAHQRDFLGAA